MSRRAEDFATLKRRLAHRDFAMWQLRYDLLHAQRLAGLIGLDDYIIGLSDLGFALDDITHELRRGPAP